MAIINQNINIGWYGECKNCKDFHFYRDNGTLVEEFENVISIMQVKESGFAYTSWSMQKHENQKKIWAELPQPVRDNLNRKSFLQDCQGIISFQCGLPYLIEIEEGSELSIPQYKISNGHESNLARVIECFECPTYPPCVCE